MSITTGRATSATSTACSASTTTWSTGWWWTARSPTPSQDDRFKDATNFIANWVSEGLIDPVSFEQSQDNFLANGKGVETYGAFYWWESETVVSNPENYIVCAPLVGPNGDQTICVSNNPEIGTGEVIIFNGVPNVEVLLAYFDRYYDPIISAQINYGPIGIVYEEELDENGMLVQKELTGDVTADELRLQNAPLGIIYLSDYAWENVVHMEPRASFVWSGWMPTPPPMSPRA